MNEVKYINAHTHNRDDDNIISIVSYRIGVDTIDFSHPYTAGVHPWDTQCCDVNAIAKAIETTENIIAIGEIGLDYAASKKNKNIQMLYFCEQIKEAAKRGLPIVIHSVKAWDDMLPTLKEYAPTIKGIMIHGFIGDKNTFHELIKIGAYISYGFDASASPKTLETLKEIPLEKLFLENDASGGDIVELYQEVANLRNISVEELKKVIFDNFNKLYDLD
ncbi:MAG: TatD family hydrolase [Rikenellaceae bacterium]